eukprot:3124691-Amphidinium_carterae.1
MHSVESDVGVLLVNASVLSLYGVLRYLFPVLRARVSCLLATTCKLGGSLGLAVVPAIAMCDEVVELVPASQ